MEVTIKYVVDAVTQAIERAFTQIAVSIEEDQGQPDHPRFFVQLLELTHTGEYENRYRRIHPFLVRYKHPDKSYADMYQKAEQLIEALKEIELGDKKISAQLMRSQIIEGQLHFNVTYSLLIREQRAQPPYMTSLGQEVHANEKK